MQLQLRLTDRKVIYSVGCVVYLLLLVATTPRTVLVLSTAAVFGFVMAEVILKFMDYKEPTTINALRDCWLVSLMVTNGILMWIGLTTPNNKKQQET